MSCRRRAPVRAVCVHGLGVSPRYLRPLIDVLRRDRDVVAPHLPQGLPVGAAAELLLAHVEQPAVFFANSMGCQFSVEAAIRAPELVRGLVLIGPTADPSAPTRLSQFARLLLDTLREPLSLNWVVGTDYLRNGPLRTARGSRFMMEHSMRERLPLVAAPAVVVRGERDPIVSQRWAEEVAALLPSGRLEVIAGAAHCAHYTHPEMVVAAASGLLPGA